MLQSTGLIMSDGGTDIDICKCRAGSNNNICNSLANQEALQHRHCTDACTNNEAEVIARRPVLYADSPELHNRALFVRAIIDQT